MLCHGPYGTSSNGSVWRFFIFIVRIEYGVAAQQSIAIPNAVFDRRLVIVREILTDDMTHFRMTLGTFHRVTCILLRMFSGMT